VKRDTGLTLAEVLVALAALGIVIAVLTTAMVTSMQQNLVAGGRTQAVQILNHLGRLASGGDARVITDTQTIWGYGQLPAAFTGLASGDGFMAPERYRAVVSHRGTLGIGTALINKEQV
jgi:prepilin-type N-terminal cleavage/methylation domain-containing protein